MIPRAVSFSTDPIAIPVEAAGRYNGYKVTAIIHSGRKISLSKNNYFYIPYLNKFVTFRGSRGKVLTINSQNKYNMIEKFNDRAGHNPFHPDANLLHTEAMDMFRNC
jgi:hypothetical protein